MVKTHCRLVCPGRFSFHLWFSSSKAPPGAFLLITWGITRNSPFSGYTGADRQSYFRFALHLRIKELQPTSVAFVPPFQLNKRQSLETVDRPLSNGDKGRFGRAWIVSERPAPGGYAGKPSTELKRTSCKTDVRSLDNRVTKCYT